MARKRRTFSAAYKTEVCRLIESSGKSIPEICRDMNLGETAVRRWWKQHQVDQGKGSEGALTTDERAELQRLRRENRTLKMEREILKKATAFFAKESL